jgi:hypothetical protein
MKRNMVLNIIIIFIGIAMSCSREKSLDNTNISKYKAVYPLFKKLEFNTTLFPTEFNFKGKIVNGLHWADKNGDNYLILTKDDLIENNVGEKSLSGFFRTLYWHGYIFSNNNFENYFLIREFHDFVKNCEYDLSFEFLNDFISVTDLDKNDIGEVTVIYKMTCASDISPWDIKLLMYENGIKYSIKGTTKTSLGNGETLGGEKFNNQSFESSPRIFFDYCNTMFERATNIK